MATKTCNQRPTRNFVKEAAQIKLNFQATKRHYIPGTYTQHHPSQCYHKLNARPIHLKLKNATEGKEIMKLITSEHVTNLIVPSKEVNVYPTIWPKNEFRRIKAVGKIVTKEERQAAIEAAESEKRRLEDESEQRKQVLKNIDKKKHDEKGIKKKDNDDTDDEDTPAKILDRSFVARQEETEEVKRANQIILATKCHAIREAQIAEKMELEQELRVEDIRLEKMMLDERDKALQDEDRKRDELKKFNAKHAVEIKKQLADHEKVRMMQIEQIEDEAKAMAEAAKAIRNDERKMVEARRKKMTDFREELMKCNKLSAFYKSLAFEEQRVAEMRALEYMRIKQEQEKQLAHDRKLAKEQKQRDADRLLEQQAKLLLTKGEQGEMELRRNQEEKEREFRRQEKEKALKRIKQTKELEEARLAQMEAAKRKRADELKQEELQFKQNVSKLKDLENKEREKQENNLKLQEKYRTDIINQINEKEKRRREEEASNKTEFKTLVEKEKERQKGIQQIIDTKLNAMRAAKIPEKFIKDVERQLKASGKFH